MVSRGRYYSRLETIRVLEIDSDFLASLEREQIVHADAPAGSAGEFSQRMLERVRVAHVLVHDLEVNLAGVAIIVRMREQMQARRLRIEGFLLEVERRLGSRRQD